MPDNEKLRRMHLSDNAKINPNYGMKGKHHTKISKTRNRKAHIGLKQSKEIILKRMVSRKGYKHSEETKRKIRDSNIGWKHTLKTKLKMRGRTRSVEHRRKLSEANKGDKCIFWKGGVSYIRYTNKWTEKLRNSIRERDNYVCQVCKNNGNYVHHIDYNKHNCDTENLITLCFRCHPKTNLNRELWKIYFSIKKKLKI